jgi:predicted kinase
VSIAVLDAKEIARKVKELLKDEDGAVYFKGGEALLPTLRKAGASGSGTSDSSSSSGSDKKVIEIVALPQPTAHLGVRQRSHQLKIAKYVHEWTQKFKNTKVVIVIDAGSSSSSVSEELDAVAADPKDHKNVYIFDTDLKQLFPSA